MRDKLWNIAVPGLDPHFPKTLGKFPQLWRNLGGLGCKAT